MLDLVGFIDKKKLETDEVLEVLSEHFGFARMEPGLVTFFRQDAQLDVVLNKRGHIRTIRPGLGVTADDLLAVRKKIEDALIFNQKLTIWQQVGFCSRPVQGVYRFRDKFQILPVPKDAPRPGVQLADHPFLLQFSFWSSPSGMVNAQRIARRAQTYFRLLDLLAGVRIHGAPLYPRHVWAFDVHEDPSNWVSRWLQQDYIYPGVSASMERFSEEEANQPLSFVSAERHFSVRGITGEDLGLPDNIEQNLGVAFDLGGSDRDLFERALAYREQARSISSKSRSLAYLASIMAIESLMDKPERCASCRQPLLETKRRCESCGQPIFETTKAFRDFLEAHVPFAKREPRIQKRLYDLRSDLAHGNLVMWADLSPYSGTGGYAREEFELREALQRILDVAIMNWLVSRQHSYPNTSPQ